MKEKSKFPTEIFPESKGFTRTRWSIGHTIFDLVKIHLFHDASNFIAMDDFLSRYSKTRQNALGYLLQKFSTDQYEKVPFFIFGDCNFCLDTKDVIQIEFEGETTDGNFALDDVTFYDGNCQTHPVEAAVEPPPSEKFQVV